MNCVFCDLEVSDSNRFMLALEKPYANIYVHKTCWNINRYSLVEFFSINYQKLLNIIDEQLNKKNKKEHQIK